MVMLYSKKSCVQCRATKKALDARGLPYKEILLDGDTEALEYVKSLGYMSAPVVVYGSESWAGYNPDKISSIKM